MTQRIIAQDGNIVFSMAGASEITPPPAPSGVNFTVNGQTNIAGNLNVGDPTLSGNISSAPGKDLNLSAGNNGNLILSSSGTGNVQLLATGTLSINGSAWPSGTGAAGQFLQTNGAGILSWTAAGGGSPGSPVNSIQFNNAGSFGGDANFTFTDPGSTAPRMTIGYSYNGGSNQGVINGTDASVLGYAPATLTIRGGNSTVSGGAVLNLTGGSGTSGSGGGVNITGGATTGNTFNGGTVVITGGGASGTSGVGGDIQLITGAGTSGRGELYIQTGTSKTFVIAADTGAWNISGGPGTSGQVLTSQGSGNQPIWTTPSSAIMIGSVGYQVTPQTFTTFSTWANGWDATSNVGPHSATFASTTTNAGNNVIQFSSSGIYQITMWYQITASSTPAEFDIYLTDNGVGPGVYSGPSGAAPVVYTYMASGRGFQSTGNISFVAQTTGACQAQFASESRVFPVNITLSSFMISIQELN
jgi:hypothetical protein